MEPSTNDLQAWIDVGGTFTDCILSRGGELSRIKVLSSGATPIQVLRRDNSERVTRLWCDANWPAGFWRGCKLVETRPPADSHSATARVEQAITDSGSNWLQLDQAVAEQSGRLEIHTPLHAPVLGIHLLLGIPALNKLPSVAVRLGTTRGTNALLTRRGADTVLAITAPFEDLLAIGDQTRPDLFALDVEKSPPLPSVIIPIDERLDATGAVLVPLDEKLAIGKLQEAFDAGSRSLAICLMHSYLNPDHETRLAELARRVGFQDISVSSQVAPLIEVVSRAETTALDAYLSPVIRSYLEEIANQLGGASSVDLQVMTSAGGLVQWSEFRGKDSILSGPAGGVVALEHIGKSLGLNNLIGIDMGGTSTDVCRADGAQNLEYESSKAGVRILTPTVPIQTVASGGGSVCWFDGVSLRVGPQSAGASPGPACYGAGGPLTLTDVNLLLDILPDDQFPFPLDRSAAESRIEELFHECRSATNISSTEALAEGLRRLACEQMAEAVRTVSIAQGRDPRDHALVGFGGAAGCHVCEVADLLGIRTVIDHPDAGLLSALGMGLAAGRRDATLPVYSGIEDVDFARVQQDAIGAVQRLSAAESAPKCLFEIRYAGTDSTISVPQTEFLFAELSVESPERRREFSLKLRAEFEEKHRSLYGYVQLDCAVELVSVRCEVLSLAAYSLPREHQLPRDRHSTTATQHREPESNRTDGRIPTEARSDLVPGRQVVGPCIINNSGSTLYIPEGWHSCVASQGTLVLEKAQRSGVETSREVDAVLRDCFAQRLSAIADQMGVVLKRTATSVNVKQRQDYSCAVFDCAGTLLANAAHVPVHLGAMGATVRGIIQRFPQMNQGDVFITNDPFEGGSHLPDITVVTPVFAPDGSPAFFVASRAHHADVGGIAPGSMSVTATNLAEEGVLIQPSYLSRQGSDRISEIVVSMQQHDFPPRKLDDLQADLNAQRAANHRGASLLADYCDQLAKHAGTDEAPWQPSEQLAESLLEASQQRMQMYLQGNFQPNERFTASDQLEDGTAINVSLELDEQAILHCDFSGSGPTSATNLNANPSITSAALLYVLRCLIDDDLPLNEGALRCISLMIPTGVLNSQRGSTAAESPAVAAGNVETSQRIVDVLLQALGKAACSQGTMNNLLFGDDTFGFYETLCGGAGATANRDGASGVHTHMTNTRLTDPEVLESRYPVRLEEFGLRHGSGGSGLHGGGDGVVRRIRFLRDVQLSLLTSRREQGPPGICGGGPGAPGRNALIDAEGNQTELPAFCSMQIKAGSQLRIESPGGGGFGPLEP